MKNLVTALALVLAIGVVVGVAQDRQSPSAENTPGADASSVTPLRAPSMKLHKDLEQHRTSTAAEVSKHTVSVEIDYDRKAGAQRPSFPGIPGMGPDKNNPFYRYDIGPFSGLVVGPNHIMVSDRPLGDFNDRGAGKSVASITVTLPNGERWPARVVGRHQQVDLALLELDCIINETCPELDIIEFPEEDLPLSRGQFIMVVGRGQNPLGTLVNDGVVSAVNREGGDAFQLDARIGNSTLGAPVVDRRGRLVGMVTLHNHQTFGQASGVSYAAYIAQVRDAYDLMKEGGFIARPPAPFMGVGANKKWPDKPGLEIGNVVAASGAQKAGLREGDIIIKVEGKDMNELSDLVGVINERKVGDTIDVTILRGDEEYEVKVTLGPRP